jgi:hypothetical protein
MKTVLLATAILITLACGAFGRDSRLNVKRRQVETQRLDSPTTERRAVLPAIGEDMKLQSSRYEARPTSFWIWSAAGGMGICLVIAATVTAAVIWRHCRPNVVVDRCRRIVERAEACGEVYPERTQEAFRLAIKRLRPVQCALAKRCPWHSDSDRIFFHLMMPATARLRDSAQDILGRAEFGIGLTLLSQQTTDQEAANIISGTWARSLLSSCVAGREREQFSTSLRDEAICHLEAAVALAPKRDEYLCTLAQAYESADMNRDSLAVIQSAITLNPAIDKYYRVLASVAWKTGAYSLYNQALLGLVESSGCCTRGHRS